MINLSKKDKSSRKIGEFLSIAKSTVNDIIKKYRDGFWFHDIPRSGRPLKTTIQEDRLIKIKSTADPRKTANDIAHIVNN